MHRGMGPQTYFTRFVVSIGCPSAHMICGYPKLIEAILNLDEWIKIFEYLKLLLWQLQIRNLGIHEKVLDFSNQSRKRVPRDLINLSLSKI